MLDWLSRLIGRRQDAPPQLRATVPNRVSHDDRIISVRDEKGRVALIGWADLARVDVIVDKANPHADLCWVLSHRDGRGGVTVPMGAQGEREFIRAMQARLAGFDNMAVIEAMSSTSNGEFQIWPPLDLG